MKINTFEYYFNRANKILDILSDKKYFTNDNNITEVVLEQINNLKKFLSYIEYSYNNKEYDCCAILLDHIKEDLYDISQYTSFHETILKLKSDNKELIKIYVLKFIKYINFLYEIFKDAPMETFKSIDLLSELLNNGYGDVASYVINRIECIKK